jgi:hypothetical protein
VVSIQHGFSIVTGQTPVAVSLAQRPELLGGKTARTGVLRSPPLAAIFGFGLANFLRVIFSLLLAAGYYLDAVALVVLTLGSAQAFFVLPRPSLLVLGDLFFVLFLILPARFCPMG